MFERVRRLRQGRKSEGQIIPGGNPYEGPRSREFPLPPMMPYAAALFTQAARSLGQAVPGAGVDTVKVYTNPYGSP
jgi:gluconate 2-dehydrogenase alpha chain